LPGFISFEVHGKKSDVFLSEAGGHRWQRVPPTEKKGRVHTSSVTGAVLDHKEKIEVDLKPWEYGMRTYKASGKGGQHRNKVESAVELTHYETGITAQSEDERCQNANKDIALQRLIEKIKKSKESEQHDIRSAIRKEQVGTGLRGDKIRTVQEQNSQVVNHLNGKSIPLKLYFKGYIEELY
jgi:peptide chain release factor 1